MHAHVLANQVVAPHHGCRRGCDTRRRCVVVAAAADEAMDLCRDKVSSPKDLKGESGTTCIVNFKGADGRVLPVEMPEVCGCWERCPHKAAAPAACFQSRSQGARRSPPYLSSPALTPPVLWSTCARRHLQDMYILNAAEGAGIDLPATCRGGICGRVTPFG